jgi:FkbM family methyltransferase
VSVLNRLPLWLPVRINGEPTPVLLRARDRGLRRYEPEAWQRFMTLVKPGARIVDVGANVGLYSLGAARKGAQVVAMEPDQDLARELRTTVRVNRLSSRIRILVAAAGSSREASVFARRRTPVSGSVDMYLGPTTDYTVVPTLTIDEIFAELQVDLIKIDVEGAEFDAVTGAHEVLSRGPDAPRGVLIELHRAGLRMQNKSPGALEEILRDQGYRLEYVTNARKHLLAYRP